MVKHWIKNKLFSLKGYMLTGIALLHIAILPLLYVTITNSHKQSSNEQFISHAREVAGLLADVLSTKNPQKDQKTITNLLDSALLGGKILYIDIFDGNNIILSPGDAIEFSSLHPIEDSFIGDHGDHIYYLFIPIRFTNSNNPLYLLRVGFDESMLSDTHKSLLKNTFLILSIYFIFIIFFITAITSQILKPLKIIRERSRNIASGNTHMPINLNTRLSDIGFLAQDLETMRTALTSLAKNMQHKATHDDLTQLPNRYLFMDRLHAATSLSSRQNKTFSLLLIDLNRFKEINDTLGHNVGDMVLIALSSRMTDEIRDSDTLARLGGDEFCIILNDAGQIIAEKIANKLIELITQPVEANNHTLQVGASIGISVFPNDGEDADTLLQHADIAMYNAKNNHLHVTSYHVDMDANNYQNLILSHDFRNSISAGHFVAHFQPKYKLPEKQLCGCELLLRWNHPSLGLIMPDTFIRIAEQENMIGALTKHTVENYLSAFGDIFAIKSDFHISINVSPNDLLDSTLLNTFKETIEKNEFLRNSLYIEVTENAIMKNPYRSASVLNKFTETGISVSVDDFGTGYSSLAYLQKFPIKELKIDKTFISELSKNSTNFPIVNATITMAHDLNLSVVAEGVDSKEILDLLIEMGCDCSQGFYHSKPVSFSDLYKLVELSIQQPD